MVPDHYSEKVAEAIALIWKSYDKTAMRRGYDLLTEAAREGDADAYCFLGRCHLGEEYVGSGGRFVRDERLASRYIAESIVRGSATGVLCALRTGDLTRNCTRKCLSTRSKKLMHRCSDWPRPERLSPST